MKIKCQYASGNKDNRIICNKVDDKSLCIYQRYCTQESEWQQTDAFATCNRRTNMEKEIKTEELKVEAPIAKKEPAKKIKIKGRVLVVTDDFSVVKTWERGNITIIPAKGEVGEEIEVEVE